MLTSQRKQHILDILQREGQVVAKTVAQQLRNMQNTVRRSPRTGARRIVATGSRRRIACFASNCRFSTASIDCPASQRKIGRAAAQMIQHGQVVILDGGTTALQIARHLPANLRATVITHSPTIAVELASR